MKIDGTGKSRLENLLKFAKVVLQSSIVAEKRNLCSQESGRTSLCKGKVFNLKAHGQQCYKYDPSASVNEKAKTVIWKYNKAHS